MQGKTCKPSKLISFTCVVLRWPHTKFLKWYSMIFVFPRNNAISYVMNNLLNVFNSENLS